MPCSAPLRSALMLIGACVLACGAALVFPISTPASYPAPAERLIVNAEAEYGPDLVMLDEWGRTRGKLIADTGRNGGLAVSRHGTAYAYVDVASAPELPRSAPEKFRRRLSRQPQARLAFGTFLDDTVVSVGDSVSFVIRLSKQVVPAVPGRPAWSRDSRRLVVSQAHRGHVQLVSYDVRHISDRRQLTQSPGRDLSPRFSPDGRMIVFERHVAGEANLFVIRPDGSGLRQLTFWPGDEMSPDFSPDGRSVVFASNITRRFQLYVLALESGQVRRLTTDYGNDQRPVWSPDGRWIAFSSDRDGDNDVYLVAPEGSSERKLTRNASEDLVEDWQPQRESIAPVIRALPGSGPRGEPLQLRYSLREDGGIARVVGIVTVSGDSVVPDLFGWDGRLGIVRTKQPHVHVIRVPYARLTSPEFDGESAPRVPRRVRFCLVAVDALGNQSRESCAAYRFRS